MSLIHVGIDYLETLKPDGLLRFTVFGFGDC